MTSFLLFKKSPISIYVWAFCASFAAQMLGTLVLPSKQVIKDSKKMEFA